MKNFDGMMVGALDGSRGKWRPTLKHKSTDADGDPTTWEDRAVVSCPECGCQFGVTVGADGKSVGPVKCGYTRPPVTRNERKVFAKVKGKMVLVRTDIREAAPAFACSFNDMIELTGWAEPSTKADFNQRKANAAFDVEQHKDRRMAEKIEQEFMTTMKERVAAEVKVRKAK